MALSETLFARALDTLERLLDTRIVRTMARYRLTIAYDGAESHGWQRQCATAAQLAAMGGAPRLLDAPSSSDAAAPDAPRELRTVQRVVELAVREVIREPVELLGASRTDSGVHARAQTAAFSCTDGDQGRRGPPDERLAEAISARLPEDALVLDARPVHEGFNPIGDCLSKGYRYRLRAGRVRPLWDRRYVAHVRETLDVDAMRAAAEPLAGEHDFAAFTNAGHGRESTVRRVDSCAVSALPDGALAIDVAGPGFLYNMVRIIAGTLIDAGRGRLTPDRVAEALASGDRRLAGPTAPARGLCLMWMRYPGDAPQAFPSV